MSQNTEKSLSGVAETLLLPLYIRAMEAERPDAILKDQRAIDLIERIHPDPSWMEAMKVDDDDKTAIVLRNREFDRFATDFLSRHQDAVIVHLGCGLDSRFERVDNGRVEWYDLDLPEVVHLRRKLVGEEGGRYHHLEYSAFDPAWLDIVSVHRPRPFLFLAEGVLMYFEEAQVKELALRLRDRFPGAELVFDAWSPWIAWVNNIRISRAKIGARYLWGLKHAQDIEGWGDGIRLLEAWYYLEHLEPRLAHHRWARRIPFLAKSSGIIHYRLGGNT